MKQIIVLVAMIALGVILYMLIAGDGDDSIKSTTTNVWKQEIERQNTYP